MIWRPTISTRTDTPFPYTTRFRSGRNTTGGAGLVVPRKPSDQFGGYAELWTGNYDMQREQAVINLPITDYFKLRFGIDHQARDGYVRNVTGIGADDLNDVDYTAGRLSMVLNLTDDIENYTIDRKSTRLNSSH